MTGGGHMAPALTPAPLPGGPVGEGGDEAEKVGRRSHVCQNACRRLFHTPARLEKRLMPADSSLSRRSFLAASGFAATTAALSARSYARVLGANDRIRV